MAKSGKNPAVETWFREAGPWRDVMSKLRTILLGCGLTEEVKWSKPCYAYEGGNIVILQGFKAYGALLFFKGALLQDPHGMLVKTGVNTVVGRQIRFTDVREIAGRERILKSYVQQAIAVEKAGLQVEVDKSPQPVPEELQRKLDQIPALKAAFAALTPGRQRAYLFYISGAKQSTTREARIEKYVRRILDGRGLNDP